METSTFSALFVPQTASFEARNGSNVGVLKDLERADHAQELEVGISSQGPVHHLGRRASGTEQPHDEIAPLGLQKPL